MSVVGPRPVMRVSFESYPKEIQKVIYNVKPGLTGIGSIIFRDEEDIITKVKSNNSHLATVIIEELGSHVLRNKDIDFNKHLGSNHKLINLVRKEYKKHY